MSVDFAWGLVTGFNLCVLVVLVYVLVQMSKTSLEIKRTREAISRAQVPPHPGSVDDAPSPGSARPTGLTTSSEGRSR